MQRGLGILRDGAAGHPAAGLQVQGLLGGAWSAFPLGSSTASSSSSSSSSVSSSSSTSSSSSSSSSSSYNPAGNFRFSSNAYAVEKSVATGEVTIDIVRTGGNQGSGTIQYFFGSGTAIAGTDYDPISGTLSFASKETSKQVKMKIKNLFNIKSTLKSLFGIIIVIIQIIPLLF